MKDDLRMLPTAIGSLPYQDIGKASKVILENFKEIPVCYQLPKFSFYENMYVQYSEKLPCLVLDLDKERIYFDLSKDYYQELERFYQAFLEKDADYFALTSKYSIGFHTVLDKLRNSKSLSRYVKTQITGPVSFGLTVTDQNKKAIYYHQEIFAAIVKGLGMKGYWQAKKIKEEGYIPLIFIDEPYFTAIGSAYTSINKEEVIKNLNEIIDLIKEVDGIVGVHCCGNTDWSILCKSKVDLISFDAYNYLENFSLFKEDLVSFLDQGGYLAYGIIPSSSEAIKEDPESLTTKLEKSIAKLFQMGILNNETKDHFIVTPSCGVGSLEEDLAEKVLWLTKEVSKMIKERKIR
ncbi:hypothetical protein KKB84_06430 [bacterium]|nr:hypothetical protein [bacterium]MBU1153583.1 hypothetical protein [bacterium]MBU2600221.1 hypothetical protein [bacterium]